MSSKNALFKQIILIFVIDGTIGKYIRKFLFFS